MGYTILVIIYVNTAHMQDSDNSEFLAIFLVIGIIYPAIYEILQLTKDGLSHHLSDPWNYSDMLYVYGSFANILTQIYFGPFHIASRVLMILVVLMLLIKTFFFLRVFPTLTPIVIMLSNVLYDLRIFLLFYFILILGFCQIFAVLGLG